jgi:hypothetical protein
MLLLKSSNPSALSSSTLVIPSNRSSGRTSIAIYTRGRPNSEPHEFELVVIRQKKAGILPNGAVIPEREAYPSNSEWGKWAWSFPIRERAFVFQIAGRMVQMEGPLGAWVRQQVALHKRS